MDMRVGLIALLMVAGLAGCGDSAGLADGTDETGCRESAAASPSVDSGTEKSVAFPQDGSRVDVTVKIGGHVTVVWSGCQEHGQITTSPADSTGPIFSSDISVYSSPRPTPPRQSGGPCCPRPPGDGVFTVRYLAQMPGTQILHGKGSAGSEGDIAITVIPLSAEEGRLVSGVLDVSALHSHPAPEVVYFQPSGMNPTQTITKPTADGRFSTRLRPGSYTIMATSPAYNDGRARCVSSPPVEVGSEDVDDITIVCTRDRAPRTPRGYAAWVRRTLTT
jgi:hypothetical protein